MSQPADQPQSKVAAAPDPVLVELLVSQPHMIEHLAANHDDDGTGRCGTCSFGAQTFGAQTGRYRFPCPIRVAAEEACRQVAALAAATNRRSKS